MRDQLRSELLKLRTTRTAAWFLLAGVALAVLGIVAPGLSDTLAALAQEDTQRKLIGSAATNAVFLSTFLGLLLVTSEFRYGTIRPTLLCEPRRRVVLAAKLAAAATVGVVFAVVCVTVAFAGGLSVLAARNVDVVLTGREAGAMAVGTIVASAFTAMLGVTVGTLIRNQVGAIVALAAYTVAVENILLATVPSVGRYLPGPSASAVAGLPDENLLATGTGAAVLLAWTLAFVAAATARNDLTDI
jgi:ABC-type transport system involved in multi-copper enzyme maturation permease subunit